MLKSFCERAIIKDEHLKKFSYLSYSRESKQIVGMLTKNSQKLKKFLNISFYVDFISLFSILLLLVFSPIILEIRSARILWFLFIFVIFQFLALLIHVRKEHYLQIYSHLLMDVSDNLLSNIFESYQLSLKDKLPTHQQIKQMVSALKDAAHAQKDCLNFISELFAIITGFFILAVAAGFSNLSLFKHVSIEMLFIIVIFLVYTIIESVYDAYKRDQKNISQKYDETFVNSQPLLTKSFMRFFEREYENNLLPLINIGDNLSFVRNVSLGLLPVLLLLVPISLGNSSEALILVVVGLYLFLRLFKLKNFLTSRLQLLTGERIINELDIYLDMIMSLGSELTPNLYSRIQNEYLLQNSNIELSDAIIWGDLNIKNLSFFSGRNDRRKVFVDDLVLPKGKVSFLLGREGIGKTLFGRLITLRYSGFEGECISIGSKDLRTFKTLTSGLKYLHYSGNREINTSYRNALSVYLTMQKIVNRFVKNVFNYMDMNEFEYYKRDELSFEVDNVENLAIEMQRSVSIDKHHSKEDKINKVAAHFKSHHDYYGELTQEIIDLCKKYLDGSLEFAPTDITNGYSVLVADLYENFNRNESLKIVIDFFRKQMSQKILDKGLLYAAIAEYISYRHLKHYVPEANIYYMDANIGLPPISQEQRIRFFYAIDIYMEGVVFVVDEPFKNLNISDSKRLFVDLVEYAKSYNAVVLVLDEKIYDEIIIDNKKKGTLGKILRFESDGNDYKIMANNLD